MATMRATDDHGGLFPRRTVASASKAKGHWLLWERYSLHWARIGMLNMLNKGVIAG